MQADLEAVKNAAFGSELCLHDPVGSCDPAGKAQEEATEIAADRGASDEADRTARDDVWEPCYFDIKCRCGHITTAYSHEHSMLRCGLCGELLSEEPPFADGVVLLEGTQWRRRGRRQVHLPA